MKRIRKYVVAALAAVMAVAFTGCNLIERTPESIRNTVYAKVGDKKITKGDVDDNMVAILNQLKSKYGDDYENNSTVKSQLKEYRSNLLDTLVEWEVLYQSANKYDVDPDSDDIQNEVDKQIDEYKNNAGSDEKYNSMLEENGYNADSYEQLLKKQAVVKAVYNKIVEDVEVTDDDIQNYYDENKDTYTKKAGADVTHVVFQFEKDSDGNLVAGTEDKMLAKANEARAKVLAGTSLKDIANSDEYKSCAKYEELGRISFEGKDEKGNTMDSSFTEGFKNLPANQVSEPVKSQFGYHLIINTAVYPEDEVTPLDDTLKESIKSNLLAKDQQDEYSKVLDELKDELKVKTYKDKIE